MDFISNPFNMMTTPNRGFKEVNGTNSTFKKRKLSNDSDDSSSGSNGGTRSRKDSFTEDFGDLSLNKEPKITPTFMASPKLSMGSPLLNSSHTITIPKPIKVGQLKEEPPKTPPPNSITNKELFYENLMKIGPKDLEGISKYLDLNLTDKLFTWNQMNAKSGDMPDTNSTNLLNNLINSPLGLPFVNFKSQFMTSEVTHTKGLSEYARYPYSSNYIGPLTKDQRIEKITKYLEKKKNRKWKHIRYNIRKDLADKRERVQGRFVKTNKSSFRSEGSVDDRCASSDSKGSLGSMRNRADRINLLDDSVLENNNMGFPNIKMKDPHFSD